jgi:hypothetical protein
VEIETGDARPNRGSFKEALAPQALYGAFNA